MWRTSYTNPLRTHVERHVFLYRWLKECCRNRGFFSRDAWYHQSQTLRRNPFSQRNSGELHIPDHSCCYRPWIVALRYLFGLQDALDSIQNTGKAHRNYIIYFIKQAYYEAISKEILLSFCSFRYPGERKLRIQWPSRQWVLDEYLSMFRVP